MSTILISFCIPTRNQSDRLEKTLDSILAQITPDVAPQIEIVISDNSTNNETLLFAQRNLSTIPFIRYFSNGTDIGADNSLLCLARYAQGKYIWWFGDDILVDGALKQVLKLLTQYKNIDLMHVGFRTENDHPIIDHIDGQLLQSGNEMLKTVGLNFGLLSTIITNSRLIRNSLENAQKHIGSEWMVFYFTLYILANGHMFYVLRTPYIIFIPPKTYGDRGFEIFGTQFYSVVDEFKNKFAKKSLRSLLHQSFRHLWRGMFVRFATGHEAPKGKRWKMCKMYWTYPQFWIALPLLSLPRRITVLLYKWYKSFFQKIIFLGP